MKANTKKLRVEESYRKLCDSVDDVLLLSTIALNNKFGFGEVRIKRFLLEVQRLAKHYSDDYDTSESREIRRIKETRQHHIKVAVKPIIKDFIPDDVLDSFYGANNDSKSYQKVKNEISKESRISLKEEAELKKSMESMRMLMPKGG